MLQSGDWVVPRLYDNIRAAKPPGIYWCQATVMTFLGDTPFAARLPSSLAAVLTALLLAIAIWREIDAVHALWTAFVFTTSALMIWSAKICLTDSVLLLCTTTALLCIYLLWRRRGGWGAVIGLAIAIACGGLVKGPFILGVLGATLLLLAGLRGMDNWLERRTRSSVGPSSDSTEALPPPSPARRLLRRVALLLNRSAEIAVAIAHVFWGRLKGLAGNGTALFRILLGVAIVIALVAPWVYLVHHRAPQFLSAARQDAMHHLETGSEGHNGWPGYHLVLIWVTFLPWSPLLPLSIVLGFKNRQSPQVRFALASVLGTWIFVEILQTKLPHYILSAFPGLAFLTADAIVRCLKGEQKDLVSREIKVGSIVLAIAIVGLATVPWWWISYKFDDFPIGALVSLSVFGLISGVVISWLFLFAKPRAALIAMGCGSLGLGALLFGVYLPQSQPLRLPVRVADVLKAHGAIHPHQVVMFEYKEPSLAFYQGGTIREYDFSLGQFASNKTEPSWIVTPRTIWDQATPQVKDAFEIIGQPIRGLDYSDALKTVEVMVLHRK
jgi:4-amino-4-deoxy-L-arabinose transferase-like glycosyltransferase